MPFQSRLQLQLEGKKGWQTLSPLIYKSKTAKQIIVVPAEFFTDLASVPRLPIAFLLAGSRATGPAVIHDYLYQVPSWTDRSLADAIFLEAMNCEQPKLGFERESLVMRKLMWAAVRAGGWHAWNKTTRINALNPEWAVKGWPTKSQPEAP